MSDISPFITAQNNVTYVKLNLCLIIRRPWTF